MPPNPPVPKKDRKQFRAHYELICMGDGNQRTKKKKVAYLMGGNQPLCNNKKLIETHEGHFVSPFTTVGWGGQQQRGAGGVVCVMYSRAIVLHALYKKNRPANRRQKAQTQAEEAAKNERKERRVGLGTWRRDRFHRFFFFFFFFLTLFENGWKGKRRKKTTPHHPIL